MKCVKCKAELKVGCIYCSVCGQEAQIVSDHNLLEDELLRELLKEEKAPKKKPPEVKKKKFSKKKKLLLSVIIIVAAILLSILAFMLVKYKNESSYSYQYQKGVTYFEEKDYSKSLTCFEKALNLDDSSIVVRTYIADIYLKMEEQEAAITMLKEIIAMDETYEDAYTKLIALYQERENYEAIIKLKETVEDEKMVALFAEFEVSVPKFGVVPDTYQEPIELTLEHEEDAAIYYTTDGTDPVNYGQLYHAPIAIAEQGKILIRAVARNQYGIYSEVVNGRYTVKFEKPKQPIVIPDRGSFTTPSTVSVAVAEGATVYYTWDNTTPTTASAVYKEPLLIPEGNHILSLILVDKYGMTSNVLKCNYRYTP